MRHRRCRRGTGVNHQRRAGRCTRLSLWFGGAICLELAEADMSTRLDRCCPRNRHRSGGDKGSRGWNSGLLFWRSGTGSPGVQAQAECEAAAGTATPPTQYAPPPSEPRARSGLAAADSASRTAGSLKRTLWRREQSRKAAAGQPHRRSRLPHRVDHWPRTEPAQYSDRADFGDGHQRCFFGYMRTACANSSSIRKVSLSGTPSMT